MKFQIQEDAGSQPRYATDGLGTFRGKELIAYLEGGAEGNEFPGNGERRAQTVKVQGNDEGVRYGCVARRGGTSSSSNRRRTSPLTAIPSRWATS